MWVWVNANIECPLIDWCREPSTGCPRVHRLVYITCMYVLCVDLQSLGSQNDKLKANYEAVRTELIHLREKHNTTRKQLLEAVESRVDADQRTETLVHKWKVQLEGRTRELESLQAKLVPQDLDMLRYCMELFCFLLFS